MKNWKQHFVKDTSLLSEDDGFYCFEIRTMHKKKDHNILILQYSVRFFKHHVSPFKYNINLIKLLLVFLEKNVFFKKY